MTGMQWTPGGSGEDIEDRRDESGGGGGGFGFGGFHLGIGGILIVGVLSLIFHQNLFTLFSGGPVAPSTQSQPNRALDEQEQPEVEFVKFVLNDVQDTWSKTLPSETNVSYRHAKLLLFRGAYPSACGTARSAIGPFYCPGDEKVYLDLG